MDGRMGTFIRSPFPPTPSELQYKEPVIPTQIDIYETYHPGAVVRILVCNADPEKKTKPGEVE